MIHRLPNRIFPFALATILVTSTVNGESTLQFSRDVRPILARNCVQCHGPDTNTRKADLRLDVSPESPDGAITRQAIIPGNAQESSLVQRVYHTDSDEIMPPPETKKQLTEEEKQTLVRWVDEGAPWEDHWAFTAPRRPELPSVTDSTWGHNEIDRFVFEKLQEHQLAPSTEAPRSTLIRRATLDLTGLPPTLEETQAFLGDQRPDAYERLIDRLFQNPRCGEHVAWQWLEAARYADTDGYQNDGPREMWPWRDWVVRAYNANLPFDQFTIEQLAGDLLPNPTLDQRIATGFNRNHRYNSESGLVFEEFLLENAVDRVDTTATVWMGLTMGCARCHDHKYDPISQQEYYQLIAYFNNVPESGRAIKFGNSEPWIKAPTSDQQRHLTKLENQIKTAETALTKAESLIAFEQAQWESTLQDTDLTRPIIPQGLAHHYANEAPITTDGSTGHPLEQIPNLICNGRFSIAFQMTPETIDQGAVLSSESKSSGRNGILVAFHEGHLRFHIISRWIAGVATLETIDPLTPDQPIHVTLTNDGTQRAKGMSIYLNGQLVPTRILHNSNSNKSGEKFGGIMQIGASHHVPGWKGSISDLRFYTHRTLSQSEAQLLSVSTPLSKILAIQKQKRSTDQQNKLRNFYLSHAAKPQHRQLFKDLLAAQSAYTKYEDSLPTSMVMEEATQPKNTYVRRRGVYHDKQERVERAVPGIFPELPSHYPGNRLGLARWLVNGDHPLTARVIVNRYWQQLFGQGLVKTPEDFGTQGRLPSHPKLLDWLAVEFVESGWDTQHLLKRILMSATYRQSSHLSPETIAKDPSNTYLSHAPRKRLPGNILRDQALYVSGLMIERQGGPSVKPFQPKNLWREASNFTYQQGKGEDLYRRSLYTYWKRTLAPPSMALLDTADREWCSVRLKKTNTPLQALALLNEEAFFQAAVALGNKLRRFPGDPGNKIALGFQSLTGRLPADRELQVLERSLTNYLTEFAAHPESAGEVLARSSAKGDSPETAETAAYTLIANVLLNLDEATTRE